VITGGKDLSKQPRTSKKRLNELSMGGIRNENIGCVSDHLTRELGSYWRSLGVEIAKHFIGAPPANQPNDVSVHFSAKEGHGATAAKGARRNVVWLEAILGTDSEYSEAKLVGDMFARDGVPPAAHEIGVQRGRRRGIDGP
jgi:hypothetical protein